MDDYFSKQGADILDLSLSAESIHVFLTTFDELILKANEALAYGSRVMFEEHCSCAFFEANSNVGLLCHLLLWVKREESQQKSSDFVICDFFLLFLVSFCELLLVQNLFYDIVEIFKALLTAFV